MRTTTLALGGAMLLAVPGWAAAHITLEQQEAAAGSVYKAVLRVGHGCEGSPTTAVRVRIPDGVIAVKPMPKPGWQLETQVEEYAEPAQHFSETLTEGVREITWSGGSLPDEWYDEFVFRGRLPNAEPGTIVYFPVVQECEQGVHRWIEIPAEGRSPGDYEEPAPGVTLTPRG
jgi:periplasmic copper chaperone A